MILLPNEQVIGGNDPAIDDALSEALGQRVKLNKEESVPHFDAGAIHILTSGSLDWLQSKLPHSAINERRFRPNILIQTAGKEPIEQSWIGETIRLGDISLEVTGPTGRCVMTTLSQGDLPSDPEILRLISEERDLNFGVHARVINVGAIHRNDTVLSTSR